MILTSAVENEKVVDPVAPGEPVFISGSIDAISMSAMVATAASNRFTPRARICSWSAASAM